MQNSKSMVKDQIKQILSNPHFWIIFFLVILISVFYYFIEINWLTVFENLPWIRSFIAVEWALKINGILYYLPIIYATIVFSWRGTVITWLVSLITIFEHLLSYNPSKSAVLNNIVILSIPFFIVAYIRLEIRWMHKERETMAAREKERQNYIAQIFQAQEEERERITQEIHDDSLQELSVIAGNIQDLIDNNKYNASAPFKEKAAFIRDRTVSVSKNLRQLCLDLRPAILDDLGLAHAIRWQVDRFQQETGINSQAVISGEQKTVSKIVSLNLFRIIQESLTNVKRHSQASRVIVTLEFEDHLIKVTIKDNGKGFTVVPDNDQLMARSKLGIVGMRKRAQMIDGVLRFESLPNQGAAVHVEVPLV
jgi:signal transduction histidine kinase